MTPTDWAALALALAPVARAIPAVARLGASDAAVVLLALVMAVGARDSDALAQLARCVRRLDKPRTRGEERQHIGSIMAGVRAALRDGPLSEHELFERVCAARHPNARRVSRAQLLEACGRLVELGDLDVDPLGDCITLRRG